MNETLSEVLKAVLIAAVPSFAGLLVVICGWLRTWIEAHTKNIVLQIVEREAFDTVAYVWQVLGDPAKRALADGKLSEDEKATLKTAAMNALQERLKSIPAHLLPDIKERCSQAIEVAVGKTKLSS